MNLSHSQSRFLVPKHPSFSFRWVFSALSAHLKLWGILRVSWTQTTNLFPCYIRRQPSSNLHFPESSMAHRVTVIWAELMFGPWITAQVLRCHPASTQREDICSTRWESRTYTNVLIRWKHCLFKCLSVFQPEFPVCYYSNYHTAEHMAMCKVRQICDNNFMLWTFQREFSMQHSKYKIPHLWLNICFYLCNIYL